MNINTKTPKKINLLKQYDHDLDVRDHVAAFNETIKHRRLTVFEVKCGDIVQRIHLWRDGEYDPHLEDHEVVSIYWNKGVTDYTNYYRKDENQH